MEVVAKVAMMILNKLQESPEIFVDVCANDFGLSHVLFAEQLDAMQRAKLIEMPLKDIDLTKINFADQIKSDETKVKIAITVAGAKLVKSLLPAKSL